QMNVDRAIDHEMATVEIEDRRTLRDRPRVSALCIDANGPGRVPDDAGFFGIEQPADRVTAVARFGPGGSRFSLGLVALSAFRKQIPEHT
ncbi:MAG TPA: hypothetical protein VIZ66_01900, partial [Sphingomicrobium sp.]